MIFDVPVTVVSATALLGVTVLLILTGRLVPRSSLRDKSVETDRWREAFEKEREVAALASAQTAELLEVAKTTHAIISAMAATSERLRGGNDALQQQEG